MRGVVVTNVFADAPAGRAGLRPARALNRTGDDVTTADIIIAVDGQRLIGFDTLISYLAKNTVPGDTVTFTIIRNGQTIDEASGTLAISRPDRFRWDYRKPYQQVIVADGTRIWIYDSDLEQVTVRKLDETLSATPARSA